MPDATPMNVWLLKLSNGDRHFLAIGERRSTIAVWRVKSGCPRVILINVPDCLKFMTYAESGELQRRGLRVIVSAHQKSVFRGPVGLGY